MAYNRGILDMPGSKLDTVLRINFIGVHNCYRFAAKQMIKQGAGGKLVAASSIYGFLPGESIAAYTASKVSGGAVSKPLVSSKIGYMDLACSEGVQPDRRSRICEIRDNSKLLCPRSRYTLSSSSYPPSPGLTPCPVSTRMTMREPLPTDSADTKERLQAALDHVRKSTETIPMKRIGVPEDVANLVSFLVSRDSDCTCLL